MASTTKSLGLLCVIFGTMPSEATLDLNLNAAGIDFRTKYLGCYDDAYGEAAVRDLPTFAGVGSVMECVAKCKGYNYFGHQWTLQCWCGNKYGRFGRSDSCTCDDPVDLGAGVNCVYEIQKADVDPAEKAKIPQKLAGSTTAKLQQRVAAGNMANKKPVPGAGGQKSLSEANPPQKLRGSTTVKLQQRVAAGNMANKKPVPGAGGRKSLSEAKPPQKIRGSTTVKLQQREAAANAANKSPIQEAEVDTSDASGFIGCFEDLMQGRRDLPTMVGTGTVAECADMCKDFKFFGRQSFHECRCGDAYGIFGRTTGCRCDDPEDLGAGTNCVYDRRKVQRARAASEDVERARAPEVVRMLAGGAAAGREEEP